jgi:hypothetical protein
MRKRNSFKFYAAQCLEDPRGDLHIQLQWKVLQYKSIGVAVKWLLTKVQAGSN